HHRHRLTVGHERIRNPETWSEVVVSGRLAARLARLAEYTGAHRVLLRHPDVSRRISLNGFARAKILRVDAHVGHLQLDEAPDSVDDLPHSRHHAHQVPLHVLLFFRDYEEHFLAPVVHDEVADFSDVSLSHTDGSA